MTAADPLTLQSAVQIDRPRPRPIPPYCALLYSDCLPFWICLGARNSQLIRCIVSGSPEKIILFVVLAYPMEIGIRLQ